MKIKLEIYIAGKTKTGSFLTSRKSIIKKHTCDILISHAHTPDSFKVEKNRNPLVTNLPNWGPITFNEVLSLGNTMPRKKKKAYKKMINWI